MGTYTRWSVLLWILLFTSSLFAQNLSDSIYQERLFYLCKVWGHAKYYHSNIAAGNVDWDRKLIDILPAVKRAESNAEFNTALLELLNSAGVHGSTGSLPTIPDSLNNNLDVAWMQHDILNSQIQEGLAFIQTWFRPQSNVYVTPSSINHPNFDTDNYLYAVSRQLNEAERLLGLFRYWNMIHYFFPYKHIMDQDWDSTLREFLLPIAQTDDRAAYHLVFKQLTTRINDSHAFFASQPYWNWDGNAHTPFFMRFIEGETVITKVINGISGVSVGDVIKVIDGKAIEALRAELRPYAHGSNDEIIERTINSFVGFGNAGTFEVTVENGVETKTVTLERKNTYYSSLASNPNPAWQIIETEDGCRKALVDMDKLEREQIAEMFNEIGDTDAIIFDIRNYPNGTLWTLVDYIYPSRVTIARFTKPDVRYPGRLSWIDGTIGRGTSNPYEGEIIMLFDERTQSQAEYTCMGLEQFPGAIKIGSTTSAADGDVALIYLPDGIRTGATFLGVYYPDYTPTQRLGIIPDIEVRPTIEGIRAGRDELMDVALSCDLSTDVMDMENAVAFKTYPNPTSELLHYEWTTTATQTETFTMELVDMLGRTIQRNQAHALTGTLDVSEVPNGAYFLKLRTDSGSFSKKIVIQ